MKSIYFNDDHDLFRQTVRSFMEDEVAPHAEEWEANRRIPKEIWGRMGEMGFLGLIHPEHYGGSDVAALRTTAVRDGDHYVINGAKTWITNGTYGDFYVVACKTDKDAGSAGISLIAMDTDLPGISASKLRKMGLHCSDTA